jgi:transposase-like protein
MIELCQMYGISRETGYEWLRRYRQAGIKALEDLERAPRRHPNQTPEAIEQAVLERPFPRRPSATRLSGDLQAGSAGQGNASWRGSRISINSQYDIYQPTKNPAQAIRLSRAHSK